MSFFQRVDDLGVVENHIQQVLALEEKKAKQMLTRYKAVRQELRDRLDRADSETFTAQQLRGTLAQVQGAIQALNASLRDDMVSAAEDMAGQGVDDLLQEIAGFSEEFTGAVVPINLDAASVADDTANLLLSRYQGSIEEYGNKMIGQIASGLSNAIIAQKPYSKVVQDLGRYFAGEEWKLHRIVRTELHNVYNIAKIQGMSATARTSIPDLMKTLIHPMDARTADDSKYADRLHLIRRLDEPFQYVWDGKMRIYMAPPDRPNDRSILVPYRPSWGKL